MGLVSSVESTVKPGGKHRNNGAMLRDRKLLEVTAILVDGEPMTLLEAKSQVRQFL